MSKKKNSIRKYNLLKIQPDPFYRSYWLAKLTNKFMQKGKKFAIEKVVFRVFTKVKLKYHKQVLRILFMCLIKNRPLLGFIPIRLGRQFKKIPVPLEPRRQIVLSLKWFVTAIKLNIFFSLEENLAWELNSNITKQKTLLTKRRIEYTKELIENRVNNHFRWK
jgi:ribosomal protein S7